MPSLLRFLFAPVSPFEDYYQRVLATSGEATAPSVRDARRDYARSLRSRLGY